MSSIHQNPQRGQMHFQVVKAQDDMEIDNDPMEVDNDLWGIMKIHNDPMEVN